MLSTPIGWLRLFGFFEGVSCLALFLVAMPLKYAAGIHDLIYPVGLAHGILFMLYVVTALIVAFLRKWPKTRFGLAFVAAVVPAGTFVFDSSLRREQTEGNQP